MSLPMRALVALLVVMVASNRAIAATQPAEPADLQRTYAALRAELQLQDPEPGPSAPQQLRQLWSVVGAWASAFVRRFPSASAADLATAIACAP